MPADLELVTAAVAAAGIRSRVRYSTSAGRACAGFAGPAILRRMHPAPDLDSLLAPGRTLRRARAGILGALPAGDQGALYDRRAATYDRLVGNGPCNRLAWGTDRADCGRSPRRRSPRARGRSWTPAARPRRSRPCRLATVACFGVLHVLDDPWAALAALAALCEQTAPGGRIFASMLVADRRPGRDVRCWTLIGLLRPAP